MIPYFESRMNGAALQNATPTLKQATSDRETSHTDWDDEVGNFYVSSVNNLISQQWNGELFMIFDIGLLLYREMSAS